MVVFNCNACGEALKKNQVEKHYQTQCRRCEVLSCVDCGKEFWGNDYEKHTKCISEEEKYGGKNFKPKPNANKGEQKQELWVSQVQAAVGKVKANAKLKSLLEQLVDYPNIPRKKAKFENFLKNSLRVYEVSMASAAWDAISAELSASNNNNSGSDSKDNENSRNGNTDNSNLNGRKTSPNEGVCDKDTNISSSSDKVIETSDSAVQADKQKKKKKIKHDDNQEEINPSQKSKNSELTQIFDQESRKKRKNKKSTDGEETSGNGKEMESKGGKKTEVSSEAVNGNGSTKENGEVTESKKSKKRKREDETKEGPELKRFDQREIVEAPLGSFKMEAAIVGALRCASDQQLKINKLRKKVWAEFNARQGDGKQYTEESFLAKFNKKLNKTSRFKIKKDIVKLC